MTRIFFRVGSMLLMTENTGSKSWARRVQDDVDAIEHDMRRIAEGARSFRRSVISAFGTILMTLTRPSIGCRYRVRTGAEAK